MFNDIINLLHNVTVILFLSAISLFIIMGIALTMLLIFGV